MSSDDVLLSYQQHALWRHNPTVLLQPVLPRQTDINNGFVRNYLLKHTHTHTHTHTHIQKDAGDGHNIVLVKSGKKNWVDFILFKLNLHELFQFYSG